MLTSTLSSRSNALANTGTDRCQANGEASANGRHGRDPHWALISKCYLWCHQSGHRQSCHSNLSTACGHWCHCLPACLQALTIQTTPVLRQQTWLGFHNPQQALLQLHHLQNPLEIHKAAASPSSATCCLATILYCSISLAHASWQRSLPHQSFRPTLHTVKGVARLIHATVPNRSGSAWYPCLVESPNKAVGEKLQELQETGMGIVQYIDISLLLLCMFMLLMSWNYSI